MNTIIATGNWDVILPGSVWTIMGISYSPTGGPDGDRTDPPVFANNRYLTFQPNNSAPQRGHGPNALRQQGCIWGTTLSDNAKWSFEKAQGSDSFWTLAPAHDPLKQISWRTAGGSYESQMSYETSYTPTNNRRWWLPQFLNLITYNGQQVPTIFLGTQENQTQGISNPYNDANQFSNIGLVPSQEQGSAQILILVQGGEPLLRSYCQGAALPTQVCRTFCSNADISCAEELNSYCNLGTLFEDVCQNYCSGKNADCDSRLTVQCAATLAAEGGDINKFLETSINVDVCGCFLKADVYVNFQKALEQDSGSTLSGDAKNCFFPYCNSSKLRPFNWKNRPPTQVCPSNTTCVNKVTINNDGTIGPVSINQNVKGCKSITGGGNTPNPTPSPNPTPTPTPNNGGATAGGGDKKNQQRKDYFFVLIIAFVVLVIFVLILKITFFHHKHSSSVTHYSRH